MTTPQELQRPNEEVVRQLDKINQSVTYYHFSIRQLDETTYRGKQNKSFYSEGVTNGVKDSNNDYSIRNLRTKFDPQYKFTEFQNLLSLLNYKEYYPKLENAGNYGLAKPALTLAYSIDFDDQFARLDLLPPPNTIKNNHHTVVYPGSASFILPIVQLDTLITLIKKDPKAAKHFWTMSTEGMPDTMRQVVCNRVALANLDEMFPKVDKFDHHLLDFPENLRSAGISIFDLAGNPPAILKYEIDDYSSGVSTIDNPITVDEYVAKATRYPTRTIPEPANLETAGVDIAPSNHTKDPIKVDRETTILASEGQRGWVTDNINTYGGLAGAIRHFEELVAEKPNDPGRASSLEDLRYIKAHPEESRFEKFRKLEQAQQARVIEQKDAMVSRVMGNKIRLMQLLSKFPPSQIIEICNRHIDAHDQYANESQLVLEQISFIQQNIGDPEMSDFKQMIEKLKMDTRRKV